VYTWFQSFALSRLRSKGKGSNAIMSWDVLEKALIRDYGLMDGGDLVLERFWNLQQGDDSIQRYIAEKKALAQRLDPPMNDKYVKFSFIRGLRQEIREHVWSQRQPKSTNEAEAIAVRFAASKRKSSVIGKHKTKNSDAKNLAVVKPPKVKRKREGNVSAKLKPERQEAFDEFKRMKSHCFLCGKSGHRRDECSASEQAKTEHQNRMTRLKKIMYPDQQ
jgi:hypothetical protein